MLPLQTAPAPVVATSVPSSNSLVSWEPPAKRSKKKTLAQDLKDAHDAREMAKLRGEVLFAEHTGRPLPNYGLPGVPTAIATPIPVEDHVQTNNNNLGSGPPPARSSADLADVVAAGSLILSGSGWTRIHYGHIRWQRALTMALTRTSEQTQRLVGSLAHKGVFDTLLAVHYITPQQMATIDQPVRSLLQRYQKRADALVWQQPKLREALLTNAVRVLNNGVRAAQVQAAQTAMAQHGHTVQAAATMAAAPPPQPVAARRAVHAQLQVNVKQDLEEFLKQPLPQLTAAPAQLANPNAVGVTEI
jgi:hypothetical protein